MVPNNCEPSSDIAIQVALLNREILPMGPALKLVHIPPCPESSTEADRDASSIWMEGLSSATLDAGAYAALDQARHGNPFSILGTHQLAQGYVIRAYYPGAKQVELVCRHFGDRAMVETAPGLFECPITRPVPYLLRVHWEGCIIETEDPYAFPTLLTEFELHLMGEGRFLDLPHRMGANPITIDGTDGVMFAVWAPNAASVSVVGNFNTWDKRRHPMRLRQNAGIWELFVPRLAPGEIYKYAVRARDGRELPLKADPLARATEQPPKTGSIVAAAPEFPWTDAEWVAGRPARQERDAPISVYEVHVGSWLNTGDGHAGSWDEASERLIPYAQRLGFTHLELLPIAEYPFGGSWGYQPLSMFAPTARLGDAASFARFVDRCHAAGLGVILDWVPAHFPSDEHGLAKFDGTSLYEHADPREGFHNDWNTLIYNLGRCEVRGFLIASALWWLEAFHLDGLRVDAVASMLYRDYSRPAGAWIPNRFGGRENLESVDFLRELNTTVKLRCPGALMIAEESTAWPGVTAPTESNGLGFSLKWNMGWMHDTLRFFERDPVHRGFHLNDISFGIHYAFSEAFMLPLSHDEVVHGKGSLLAKFPGDTWQQFANLRLCLALMWTHPGKKLLFMGGEFGVAEEWNADAPFPWPHPGDRLRQGLSQMVGDLNRLYRSHPQLHRLDTSPDGFVWLVSDEPSTSVFAFLRSDRTLGRRTERKDLLVVLNATPMPQHEYRLGVPTGGRWGEMFNSDASSYGGSGLGNLGASQAEPVPAHGMPFSLRLTVPPLGLLVLQAMHEEDSE